MSGESREDSAVNVGCGQPPESTWVARLADAARAYVKSDDWFVVLGYARRWNMDDWCALARGRVPGDVLREDALHALWLIESEAMRAAVIRGEKCTTPVPHDREDCNGW